MAYDNSNASSVAARNNGAYEEASEKEAWLMGMTNNGIGDGCPDGTHPSDYSKGKKVNDMHPSEHNGNMGRE